MDKKVKIVYKLQIEIDCEPYTDNYQAPETEFFKTLDSVKGLKYVHLDQLETNMTCEEEILKRGLTNILTPEVYHELYATPYDKASDIIIAFKKFLDGIIISDHLIIIDPYIFSDTNEKQKYSDFVTKIFSTHLKKLQKVTFITNKRTLNKDTKDEIYNGFLNVKSKLQLDTKFTDKFHDRFWICDNRGLFVGTSLNGIGSKYCLIDYIDHDDVLGITKSIKDEGLLNK